MSLINDALKRAKQNQSQTPPPLPPMPPAEKKSSGNNNWILLLLIVLLVVAASFFIGVAMSRRLMLKADFAHAPVETPSASPTMASVQPPPVVKPASNPAPELVAVPVVATPATPAPAALAPAPATNLALHVTKNPPVLKIQGLVYDLKKPWAIISGKTVFVGDRLNEFQVKAISRNTVTLTEAGGQEKILSFGK